jgi:predicted RecA/RadA family phage recombinase
VADAVKVREWDEQRITAAAAVALGEIWQMADGAAAYYERVGGGAAVAGGSGDTVDFRTSGKATVTKVTGVVILAGGRVYWDHSANNATYRKVNDRDFYIGRAVQDAASADASIIVDLNADPPYDLDLARDPFATVTVGTQGLNTMGVFRRGGAHKFILSATNEAQKLDALSKDGFHKNSNAIVEFALDVISDGAGTVVDVSVGIANATHATDADSITDSVFCHLDANNTNINFESDDGTTEVAATDSTIDYTEGTRFEVWFDLRNPADVQVYVNAALVLGATVFNIDASVATWKLLCHIEKTSSTDAYELDLEWMRARYMEQ